MPFIWHPPKLILVMKITVILIFASILSVSASSFAQKITLNERNVPLEKILTKIRQQSGYDFVYNSALIKKASPITIRMSNVSLETALSACLENQELSFEVQEQTVLINKKVPSFLDKVVDAFTPPIDLHGKVLDEKGQPLAGATVKVKGFKQSTSTDNEGRFYLQSVDENATLIITYIGYKVKEVPANSTLSITLEIQSSELQEVTVAYGKQEQRAITGAVQVLSGKEIETLPNRSFDKSLQGLVPGLLVTSGNGQPGSGVGNFVLRGIATASDPINGSTVRNPLIIIDGIPITQDPTPMTSNYGGAVYNPMNYDVPTDNPLAQLNPSDIESFSVLKDAAAIALYGAKASNGVILITTKRGKAGKTRFTFRQQTDFSKALLGEQNYMNQTEYLGYVNEMYKNTTRYTQDNGVYFIKPYTDAEIIAELQKVYPLRKDGTFYPQPDWIGELYNSSASTLVNELSMSGGNDKSIFYLNAEYTKQNGVIRSTGYDRKGIRFNFENRPKDWLKIGLNSALSYNVQKTSGTYYQGTGSESASGILRISPLNPIRLEDGSLYLNFIDGGSVTSPQASPAAIAAYNTNQNSAFRGLNKLFGEARLMNDFVLSSSAGVDFSLSDVKETFDRRLNDPARSYQAGGRVQEHLTRRFNFITTNTLLYDKMITADHHIDVLIGQEAKILQDNILGVAVQGLASSYYDQINSPGVTVLDLPNGYLLKETQLSYFGQLNYGFKNRYYLTGSVRRDGSSRFGADRRFGTYWSTGLGWVASEELFMKSLTWLSYLKFRGSIGAAGNAGAIDRFTPYSKLSLGGYYGEPAVSPQYGQAGNADVEWEETFTWDTGVEIRMFGDRLSLTADVYKRRTDNAIFPLNLPLSTGYVTTLGNLGIIDNKGVELSLAGTPVQSKDFSWQINANWSTNSNKLVKANVSQASSVGSTVFNKEGESINSYYLRKWAGVDPLSGAPTWYDASGNITNDIDAAAQFITGKPQPDGFGSITNRISIKRFELSAQLYYQYGYKIYADLSSFSSDGLLGLINQSRSALNAWRAPGDLSANPKVILSNPTGGPRNNSSRNLFDGDYVRLQNVIFAYNFDNSILKKIHLQGLRVFAQGNNLGLWTKYNDRDPSGVNVLGLSNAVYPAARSYSLGLNVTF